MSANVIEDWLIAISMATDDNSPFKGMIDLSEIFDLPLPTQQKIYDALTEGQKDALARIYGKDNA